MSALAAAPLPFIMAATLFLLALLAVIAKAVFAETDEPARRLCAILATLRRRRPGTDAWQALLPARSADIVGNLNATTNHSTDITIPAPPASHPGGRTTTSASPKTRR